jgi:ribose transport system substrate-binding protein
MSSRFTGSRRTLGVAIASTVAIVLLVSGCSASNAPGKTSTGSAVPKAVSDELATYSKSTKFDFKGRPFDVSSVAGKTVWWVTQEAGNPFLATVGDNFKKALKSVGVNVVACDGKSNPVDANNCLRQAVAQNASAVQMDGPDPTTYVNSLSAATAAKIPVLAGSGVDASTSVPSGVAGVTSQPFGLTGQLAADWIIADSGAKANVLLITTPDVIGSTTEQQGFAAQMKKYCKNCNVTVKGVTLGNWATDVGPTTSAALVKDPSIDYVVPVFDPMTQFTNPAIQQSGRSSSVKVVTVNGNLGFMKEMSTSGSLVKAMVGLDLDALGYIEADQMLRAMTGNSTVNDSYGPTRVFTSKNIGSLTLTTDAFNDGSWYGGAGSNDSLFKTIWQKG